MPRKKSNKTHATGKVEKCEHGDQCPHLHEHYVQCFHEMISGGLDGHTPFTTINMLIAALVGSMGSFVPPEDRERVFKQLPETVELWVNEALDLDRKIQSGEIKTDVTPIVDAGGTLH